jgi:hypothetical protein
MREHDCVGRGKGVNGETLCDEPRKGAKIARAIERWISGFRDKGIREAMERVWIDITPPCNRIDDPRVDVLEQNLDLGGRSHRIRYGTGGSLSRKPRSFQASLETP